MAYVWEDNPLFLSYNGVDVYYIFRNDFESEGVREYWYGLTPAGSDNGGDACNPTFDVRDLSTWGSIVDVGEESVKEAIRRAIDIGELTQEGIMGA